MVSTLVDGGNLLGDGVNLLGDGGDLLVVVVLLLLQKSNAHAHILDWCAFALDVVKNVTNGRTNGQGVSRSRIVLFRHITVL